jgi:hypothetical protein
MVRSRRSLVALLAIVALVLGATGCGGDSEGNDATSATTQAPDGADVIAETGDDTDAALGDLPDPCDLVSDDVVEGVFGEPVAEPEAISTELGAPSRSCTWVTQASIDAPSLDDAGRVLVLTVLGPPNDTMTAEELFSAAEASGDEAAAVCERSFWLGGMLHATQAGVYLTGTAGLADASPEAKDATEAVVVAACDSL